MNNILLKNIVQKKKTKIFYKWSVLLYSLYFIFSTPAFAHQVEAPELLEKNFFDGELILASDEEPIFYQEKDSRAERIRAYYNRFNLPLAAEAESFVKAADQYDIDWTLLAAIGMIESTGGKHACSKASYSAFGWGSCKINFDSYAESIDRVSKNLGGHNPNTARYYKNKSLRDLLESYNPPHIVADYADQVMKEMKKIKAMQVSL